MLTNLDLTELTEFRRELHRHPELSGEEVETASKITAALRSMLPTRILTGLGGHGVAAVFDSGKAGPTVLFRAELDALPIEERNNIAWLSQTPGKSHVCGHLHGAIDVASLCCTAGILPGERIIQCSSRGGASDRLRWF